MAGRRWLAVSGVGCLTAARRRALSAGCRSEGSPAGPPRDRKERRGARAAADPRVEVHMPDPRCTFYSPFFFKKHNKTHVGRGRRARRVHTAARAGPHAEAADTRGYRPQRPRPVPPPPPRVAITTPGPSPSPPPGAGGRSPAAPGPLLLLRCLSPPPEGSGTTTTPATGRDHGRRAGRGRGVRGGGGGRGKGGKKGVGGGGVGGKVGKEGKGKGKGKGGEAPPSLSAPAAGLPALSGAPAAARPLLPPPPPPLPPWCGSRAGRAPLTGPGRGGAATAGSLRRLAWGGRGWGGGEGNVPVPLLPPAGALSRSPWSVLVPFRPATVG